MKVLVNGGINISELDGWWAEAYTPEVGWAIGDGQEHGDDPAWDAIEAEQLYNLLENEVVSEFYTRNERGLPTQWLSRMRASMSKLTPQFSAVRTVREYTEQHYLPAATAYRERAAFNGAMGTSIVNWEHSLNEKWSSLKFGEVRIQSSDNEHIFEADVYLDGLDRSFVRLELYAEGINSGAAIQQVMTQVDFADGESPFAEPKWEQFRTSVPTTRPAADFTVRIVPNNSSVAIPQELNLIHWQR